MDRSPDDTDPAIANTGMSSPSGGPDAAVGGGDTPVAVARRSASGRGKGPRQVRAGDTLGRYELGDELGEGGMATVFRARDRELRRDVAVKVLFPHLARRDEIVRRFHREARAAAGLEHPNILRIYDVGGAEADDPPYIVMELIRGRTLLQEIEQRGAMLAEIAACIGALLADALAAAHAAGVIHRDIKPANVLIAPGGRLLLADFGVARLETEDSLVTRTGALLGTPAYMSPEQASGDIATARSDLYSLGATLYQLATGALPYSGPPAKVISLIAAGGLIAPVRRRPACGAELSRLIERLMAVDPSARPAGAIALANELRGLAAAGGLGDTTEELAAYFEDPDGFLRARIPTVVSALIGAAKAAVAEDKLPRAMALANRATALAPADPAVTALVEAVTDGGRAQTRKRRLAIGGLVIALAGGATALGWQLVTTTMPTPTPDSSHDRQISEAPETHDSSAVAIAPGDAISLTSSARSSSSAGAASAVGSGSSTSEASRVLSTSSVEPAVAATDPVVAAPDHAGSRPRPPTPATRTPAPHTPRTRPAQRGSAATSLRSSDSAMTSSAGSASTRGPAPIPATPDSASSENPLGRSPAGAASPGRKATMGGEAASHAETPSAPSAVIDPPPDAASEPASAAGHVIVRNYLWCNIWIDNVDRGNRRDVPLEVAPGHHVVRCVNPAVEWTQETFVAAGATQVLKGTEPPDLEVTLAIDAMISGKQYSRGSVVKLKPSSIDVIAGGKKQFIVFRASCTLRDSPELGCYPPR